jgi:hypothetical protein
MVCKLKVSIAFVDETIHWITWHFHLVSFLHFYILRLKKFVNAVRSSDCFPQTTVLFKQKGLTILPLNPDTDIQTARRIEEPIFFLRRYSPNLGLGLPPWNSPFHLGTRSLTIGRTLGRVISLSQGLYLYTNRDKRARAHTHTHTSTHKH